MSDDFGTVNVKRGDRSREIESLRQQYGHHRDALTRMVADAPTELLAKEYQRLIRELDASLRKLDELEGRAPLNGSDETQRMEPELEPLPPPPGALPSSPRTAAGDRPLATPPSPGGYTSPSEPPNPQSRVALIVVAGAVVLALIGWLIYRASSDRRPPSPIGSGSSMTETTAIETTTVTPATVAPEPIAPPAGSAALTVSPASADYGTIRKGTRAVRQFDVTNTTAAAINIAV
ncbi:MAG: hypothetical protein JWO56_179, partial [Acidobacteria bacterium]|nr:hypothetical protein [Acidobacteriota bacterium]